MATVITRTRKLFSLGISTRKGNEILGVVLAACVVLLAASLLSFHPEDPSVLHQPPDETSIHNWIGPVGAQVAALHVGGQLGDHLGVEIPPVAVQVERLDQGSPHQAGQLFRPGGSLVFDLLVLSENVLFHELLDQWFKNILALGGSGAHLAEDQAIVGKFSQARQSAFFLCPKQVSVERRAERAQRPKCSPGLRSP